jgi:hypothetical protein
VFCIIMHDTVYTRIFVENYGLEEGQVSTKRPKLLPN